MKRYGSEYAGAELVQCGLALGYGIFALGGWAFVPLPLYLLALGVGAFLLIANKPVPPVDPR